MSATIKAIYRQGLFEPLEAPSNLAENQMIELEVRALPPVTSDPRIMSGKPCITGTRMPIDWVIGYLEAGRSLDQFLREYPQYSREQITAAIHYAIAKMGYPEPKAK
jgi:uncharacterized protein (DUF433 family)